MAIETGSVSIVSEGVRIVASYPGLTKIELPLPSLGREANDRFTGVAVNNPGLDVRRSPKPTGREIWVHTYPSWDAALRKPLDKGLLIDFNERRSNTDPVASEGIDERRIA